MSFFYHGPPGMAYFIILSLVCAYAIWRGGREMRLFSYCVLGVFLADRTLLATMTNEAWMIGLGALAEFIAILGVVWFVRTSATSGCIGFLFFSKMVAYVCLLGGFISFETMAAWTELAGYLQLLIIGGGTFHANRGKYTRDTGDIRHGNYSLRHIGKGWVPPE